MRTFWPTSECGVRSDPVYSDDESDYLLIKFYTADRTSTCKVAEVSDENMIMEFSCSHRGGRQTSERHPPEYARFVQL